MAKQPYIPIYIGDWEKDTNCISALAEFALLKLTFKLFNSEKRGIFEANFRTLSILFKQNIDETKEIFQELIDNNILNIEPLENERFRIISRRMIREGHISEARSNNGSQGGRGNKSENKANEKQTESKQKAKLKQIPDIDIDNISKIVELLNNKGGKSFKIKNDKTVQLLRARFKDGYSFDDISKVVEMKCEDWSDCPKMKKFLRPETLFGPKFEGYFNELPKPNLFSMKQESSTIHEIDPEIKKLLGTFKREVAGKI